MKTPVSLVFFLMVSSASAAETVNLGKYNYEINNSITTFLVINYHSICNEVNFSKGDYLNSLLVQAGVNGDNEARVIEKIKKIITSDESQYQKIQKIQVEALCLKDV